MVFKSSESTAASEPESSHHPQLEWLSVSGTVRSNLCPFCQPLLNLEALTVSIATLFFYPLEVLSPCPLTQIFQNCPFLLRSEPPPASLTSPTSIQSPQPSTSQFTVSLFLSLPPRLIDRSLKKEKDKNLARLA